MKHAVYSPSSSAGWLNCVGFQHEPGTNQYAEWGTACHEVSAWSLKTGLSPWDFPDIAMQYEVDERMREYAQTYVEYLRGIPGEHQYELPIPIGWMTGEEDAVGHADAVVIENVGDDLVLHVVDLKTGHRPVKPTSSQLRVYAAGALYLHRGKTFDRVKLTIVQPSLERIESIELDPFQLGIFATHVAARAKAHREQIGERTPSEEGCEWCANKATCTALSNWVQEEMDCMFEQLDEPVAENVEKDLAFKYKAIPLIEMWIDAVKTAMYRRVNAGDKSLGYKLVSGRKGNRQWADTKFVEDYLRRRIRRGQWRFKLDDFFETKLNSPAKVLGVLKKVGSPKHLKDLTDAVVQSAGNPQLVLEDDPRPAITGVDFETFEKDE